MPTDPARALLQLIGLDTPDHPTYNGKANFRIYRRLSHRRWPCEVECSHRHSAVRCMRRPQLSSVENFRLLVVDYSFHSNRSSVAKVLYAAELHIIWDMLISDLE